MRDIAVHLLYNRLLPSVLLVLMVLSVQRMCAHNAARPFPRHQPVVSEITSDAPTLERRAKIVSPPRLVDILPLQITVLAGIPVVGYLKAAEEALSRAYSSTIRQHILFSQAASSGF